MFSDFSIGYGYLPVGWAIFTSLTFLMCYGIAVSQHHIYPFVPAISDTGARVPESNIFSEFFNFSMVLMALSLFVRTLKPDQGGGSSFIQSLLKTPFSSGYWTDVLSLQTLQSRKLGFNCTCTFNARLKCKKQD